MTHDEVMSRLQALGNEKVRERNAKHGVGENQFGVQMSDVRALAKEIKTDQALGLELWATGNHEAMLLATLIVNPKKLSEEEVDRMVRSAPSSQIADWFNTNVAKLHPQKEALRLKWMTDADPAAARAGWSLTTERVIKAPEGLDLVGLLDRIEAEMGTAPELPRWTMNYCLAEIGIHFPEHRKRATAIGEKLGVFRDYPVSKGCVSPFAPIWISEMVKRQG